MSNKKGLIDININQLKEVLTHVITNNRFIQAQGKIPTAAEVIGDSGLGKTSAIGQLAEELNLDLVKLNLAQIEELGDLVGFPIRQFEVLSDDNTTYWIDEHGVTPAHKLTGANRTGYCPPEWIAGKTRGGILLLDDFNRADPRFLQATMELIDRQTYISWKLPEDWHIILTSNPDNGSYHVNSVDDAQRTRYMSFNLKFDVNVWAHWAEASGIDTRCINFMLMHPELHKMDSSVGRNARSITTFFNSISSLQSFENSLPLIQLLAEGSVGQEFGHLFTLFINNKLDKLITPEAILFHDDLPYVLRTLTNNIGKDKDYRADIASTLATRMVNYALVYSETHKIEDSLADRIDGVMEADIFTKDLKFSITRSIFRDGKVKFRTLMMKPNIIKYTVA